MGYFRPLSQTKFINDANLVSYWKLDGNSNDSKGSNNGTDTNMSYSAGQFDSAGVFASSTAKIDVGNSSTLNVTTGDMTWSWWINPSSLTDYKTMLKRGALTTNGFYIYFLSNKMVFTSNQSGASQNVSSLTNISTGVWQLFTIVKSGTTISHYLNGKFDGSGTIINPTTSTNNFIIGQYDTTNYYSGSIDDTAIFSRALSAGEVAELYQSQTLGEYLPNSNTKLLLHLNGSSADSSGNNNNGTDTDITYSQANGKFGQGAGFNGSSSKIVCGNVNNFEYNLPFSVFSWIKTSTNGYITIVSKQDSDANSRGWGMFINPGHKIEIQINNVNGSNLLYNIGTKSVDDGNWHFVGFTYNGSGSNTGLIIYVDGNVDTYSRGGTLSATIVNSSNLQVGSRAAGQLFFNGSIDEVKIEAEAWSASEVKKYYSASKGRWATL